MQWQPGHAPAVLVWPCQPYHKGDDLTSPDRKLENTWKRSEITHSLPLMVGLSISVDYCIFIYSSGT